MKNAFLLSAMLLITSIFAITACDKGPLDGDDDDTFTNTNTNTHSNSNPIRPTAGFTLLPGLNIVADQTTVTCSNSSTGTISSYFWHFGAGESTSDAHSPSYRFDREGYKTVKLTVSGPAGTDTRSIDVRIHAMDPTLHNYSYFSTQSEGHINLLRQSGLKIGRIKVQNNYNGAIKLVMYHPDSWLSGDYSKFAQWSLPSGTTYFLNYDGQNMNIGNDWGIQVVFENDVKSCIRSLHYVSGFSNGVFNVVASEVYNGG